MGYVKVTEENRNGFLRVTEENRSGLCKGYRGEQKWGM